MKKKIYDALIGRSIDDARGILEQFGVTDFVDEGIDDGCDGPEDDYVMKRCYDCGPLYVRIYYGNNTRVITCVNIMGDN